MTPSANPIRAGLFLLALLVAGALAWSPPAMADDAVPGEPTSADAGTHGTVGASPAPDGAEPDADAEAEAVRQAMETLLRYHEHPDPDLVDPTLRTLLPSKPLLDWSNAAFVMGFLTAAIHNNEDRVVAWYDAWIPGLWEQDQYTVTLFALAMSQHPETESIFDKMLEHADATERAMIVDYTDRQVDLPLDVPPGQAFHLPMVWGWYCATGDEAALDRILEYTGLERNDTLASDAVLTLSFAMGMSDAARDWAQSRIVQFDEGDDHAHLQAGELEAILADSPDVIADPEAFGLTPLGVPATRRR